MERCFGNNALADPPDVSNKHLCEEGAFRCGGAPFARLDTGFVMKVAAIAGDPDRRLSENIEGRDAGHSRKFFDESDSPCKPLILHVRYKMTGSVRSMARRAVLAVEKFIDFEQAFEMATRFMGVGVQIFGQAGKHE